MESAAKTLKRVTLELGGNDPAIICKNVNVEEVAPKVATMAFMNSGQVCSFRLSSPHRFTEEIHDGLETNNLEIGLHCNQACLST